jgi:hypothetical protein
MNSTLCISFPARLVVGSETLLAFIATNGCFKKRYAQYPFPGYPDVGFEWLPVSFMWRLLFREVY